MSKVHWMSALTAALAAVTFAAPAAAQSQQLRLAAPADCATNPGCAPALRTAYGVDAKPHLHALADPDAGLAALDDGSADVAVAFSSDPGLSRPDVIQLRDDRHAIDDDFIVPVVRSSLLRSYKGALRARLNAASQELDTYRLRGLNQEVADGKTPAAAGSAFANSNALGGNGPRRSGPVVRIGYQDFAENEALANYYAEALRGDGFRVTVQSARGFRGEAVQALRRDRIDLWAGYSGSLRRFLGSSSLSIGLRKLGAEPLKRSRAQNRNRFVMHVQTARALGIETLSDLANAWNRPASRASRKLTAAAKRARADEPVAHAAAEPLEPDQWAISPGSVLDLPGAWAIAQGQGVTVAVVDSGTKLDHPDLAPNIWVNFREVPGNGVDDDGNGYVDDVYGVDLTSTRAAQNLNDGHGHGTHVAGIIAAAMNGKGVVGVAPRARIMTVRVLDDVGAGTTGAVAEGIRYAAANGARIINASLQGDVADPRLVDAINAAAAANALVVVSAGNDARDIDIQPAYPAAIPAPNLVSVAATAPLDGRDLDSYSNFGRLNVGVAAPGGAILSTTNDGAWGEKSGTSMASPMVAGVAALMMSANPNLSAVDARSLLFQNAGRSSLPVAAGYVDALTSVLSATTAVGYDQTQKPRLQVLRATSKSGKVELQVGVVGSTQAIKSYRVMLDSKRVATIKPRGSLFKVSVRAKGKRLQISALNGRGRALATVRQSVSKLRKGKRLINYGHGIGS